MSTEDTQWCIETFARLRPSNKAAKNNLNYDIKGISCPVNLTYSLLQSHCPHNCVAATLDIIKAKTKAKRLELVIPKDTDSGLLHSSEDGTVGFNFNSIFDVEATQEEVFSTIAEQKVVDVFRGLNATIVSNEYIASTHHSHLLYLNSCDCYSC